ncbi:putative phosphate transport system substrate-binding protein [Nostoc linckia NIES-25]|nr:putative phosphate transport system substrate-binding protein [Nostoc linckia NIES-25]
MNKQAGKIFDRQKSQVSAASFFVFTAVSTPLTISLIASPVLAQPSTVNTSFPVPQSLPTGTQVRINGTTSMEKIDRALAQQFQTKFPNTSVTTAYDGTDASLKALLNEQIDLAAIGRSLTESEKAQGLASIPITRNKIAVIVGKNNPYINNLTSEQFAKIFRGDVTDWSQVGGSAHRIRSIDRPENSDLRQALQNYPVFQKAPFKTGTNAIQVSTDSTEAVVKELGTDGIGYAIADGVINNPNVKILRLHNVLPTDPRYPFSQPLGYAYDKFNPSPAAAAFLGFATIPANGRIIEQARVKNANIIPETASTPTATTAPTTRAVTEPQRQSSWWWLLLIPLLGGLLWWLLSRRSDTSTPTRVATPALGSAQAPENRIVLTPRNCRDVYAYWEISNQVKQDLQRQDGRGLKVRLYDVTDIDIDRQTPHSMKEFDVDEQAQDIHLAIAQDNRDYLVELGCLSNNNRWLNIARSAKVRVPACEPVGAIPTANTGVAAASLGDNNFVTTKDDSRVILVPRNSRDIYAYWEIPEARKAELQRLEGRKLALRVYDSTGIDLERLTAHSFRQFECDESTQDLHIPIVQSDRDYVAQLGYITANGHWLKLAESAPIKVSSTLRHDGRVRSSGVATNLALERIDNPSNATTNIAKNLGNRVSETIAEITPTVAGLGTTAQSFFGRKQDTAILNSDCRIILVPRNTRDAYAYWEIADEYKTAARSQGGRRFVLRVHDVTNLDIDHQSPHITQEYPCDECEQDKHVAIPASDRDYLAEIGYYTDDGRWLSIIRSFYVHIPSNKVLSI